MIYIKSFKNYEEFKQIFAVVEHGNGVKSRKNKILLAWLKDRKFLKTWLEYSNGYMERHGKTDELDAYSYLAARNMDDVKRAVGYILETVCRVDSVVSCMDTACYKCEFAPVGWYMYHTNLYLDDCEGLCEDGDTKAVRYVNAENRRVFKMKAGKFITSCIESQRISAALPEQVKRWVGEEFARDWQAYTEDKIDECNNLTLYVGSDLDDFREIYDSEECEGDFGSCMVDEDQYYFYSEAVDASAASLRNSYGKIVARCIVFNDVKDQDGKTWRLAERQYASEGSDVLKQILVNKLIAKGLIDGYKRVGVDCHDNRNYVANNGDSLRDKKFSISCRLEEDGYLSYQDSFVYYDRYGEIAYNYPECDYTDELNTTESYFYPNHDYERWSEWEEEWIGIDDAVYDDYNEDWMSPENAEDAIYLGRDIQIHCDRTEDFVWSEHKDKYIHCSEAVEIDDDWYLDTDTVEDIAGETRILEDCKFSNVLGDYVYIDDAIWSGYSGDWLYEPDAVYSELTEVYYADEGDKSKDEADYRKKHALMCVVA